MKSFNLEKRLSNQIQMMTLSQSIAQDYRNPDQRSIDTEMFITIQETESLTLTL